MSKGAEASVKAVLTELQGWANELRSRDERRLSELASEIAEAEAALAEVRARLQQLLTERQRLDLTDEQVDGQLAGKAHRAIFQALARQQEALAVRSGLAAEVEEERRTMVLASLGRGESAQAMKDYQQFRLQVLPTLQALPESYRGILLSTHQQVETRLRQLARERLAEAGGLEAEPLDLEVVYGVDTNAGQPEVLVVALPVRASVLEDWASREDDLELVLAARVLQGVYESLQEVGFEGAEVDVGGAMGLLVIEADLRGARRDVAAVLFARLREALECGQELVEANVQAFVRPVHVDYLFPPEEAPTRVAVVMSDAS